jgi:hypothetical protein
MSPDRYCARPVRAGEESLQAPINSAKEHPAVAFTRTLGRLA